jgi:hypothetical protein
MAYVREKTVPGGKDDRGYKYWQVVEGRRVKLEDGSSVVRQKVLKHLGRFPTKAAALEAAGLVDGEDHETRTR